MMSREKEPYKKEQSSNYSVLYECIGSNGDEVLFIGVVTISLLRNGAGAANTAGP